MIPFKKTYLTGNELKYMEQALLSGKISSGGMFTERCQQFFESKYKFPKVLLTNSCTDALEMAAILIEIKKGDEVIVPSFTFVSSVNPFILRGAKIVFTDSKSNSPCINENELEALITPKTKAIVVVHYAGVACNMDTISAIAAKHNLFVIEDAAHSIDAYYKRQPQGSIGHLAAFSFHETKNITCGEGGMLVINDHRFIKRAEMIAEKGTNRKAFMNGEIQKYEWVDVGSSFMPGDVTAAFLFAQLESITDIQTKRIKAWQMYYDLLAPLAKAGHFELPFIPEYSSNNAHLFYIVCNNAEQRSNLMSHLLKKDIASAFHYQSLHRSPYYQAKRDSRELKNADRYSECLLRLPLYNQINTKEIKTVTDSIIKFFKK